jgi:Glycosyltransferase WbsX
VSEAPITPATDRPPTPADARARLVAFYLPQFYPVAQNDEWWGNGFTEWTQVARAQPLFRGHRQPRMPADLGFCDLRVAETRAAQAALARDHGIEGFCYWHYWFLGDRLLERPFDEVLASGEPEFPFCLAWANHDWTTNWIGTGHVLQKQRYSHDDDVAHARWLLRAFADRRYLRVEGRPLFAVYRPDELPDPQRTTDTIRGECTRAGLEEPYLLGVDSLGRDLRSKGFDGMVSWEPQLGLLPQYRTRGPTPSRLWRNLRLGVASPRLRLYDIEFLRARTRQRRSRNKHPYHPTVLVGWDSTPRRGRDGIVLVNDDVAHFEDRLTELVDGVSSRPFESRLVFLNAWNEWGEGNYLEPDVDTGRARLEAVRRVGSAVRPSRQAVAP